MSFAFKKFRFFSSAEVPGHAWPHHATCSAPNKACMACGCENGSIQLLDESFQPLASFAAHGYRVFEVIWLQVCTLCHTHVKQETLVQKWTRLLVKGVEKCHENVTASMYTAIMPLPSQTPQPCFCQQGHHGHTVSVKYIACHDRHHDDASHCNDALPT
ncbi:hypothetical protein DUNSADRAFT_16507 [Dunaliella salina]|uniref:Encoded protein n=1 Tax=Dunaliella salina TaxID=3046 RepID=A0ABQ7G3F3_DUNSA|nr:hypothetical protein DUNSADRAFT_16507 [Dunaliella salina]|eukprot:KAF5829136.1 hypothetical protein DUNSADRAFT_16507 [Dunaliella salina]